MAGPTLADFIIAGPLYLDLTQSSDSSGRPARRSRETNIQHVDDEPGGDITRTSTRGSIATATSWRALTSLPSRGLKRVKNSFSQRTTTSEGSPHSRIQSNASKSIFRRWTGKSKFFAEIVSLHPLACSYFITVLTSDTTEIFLDDYC